MSIIKQHWAFFVALVAFVIAVTIALFSALIPNNFRLTYAVDDAFIHMAIAKHFAQNGVWGVTAAQFTSSSSSPLWELLLALIYAVFGVNEIAPLILNLVFAIGLLIFVYRLLSEQKTAPLVNFLALCALIFFTSLPSLILTGMEHTLHALLTVAFIHYSAKVLAKQQVSLIRWGLLALLLVAARYEGMFTIAIVCFLLLIIRRKQGFLYALLIGACGATPIMVYGLFSLAQGWYFLPNSVLLKSSTFDLSQPLGILSLLGLRSIIHMLQVAHILALVIGLVYVLFLRRAKQMVDFVGWITLIVILLHMQFSQTGAFYRYEAYLVVSGLAALALLCAQITLPRRDTLTPKHLRHIFVGGFVVIPMLWHGATMLIQTPTALINNYHQQYQMAQFVRQYYNESSLALNDIGAVSHFSNIRLLDIVGLASLDMGRLTLENNRQFPTAVQVQTLAQNNNVTLAIVSEGWVNVPDDWIRVGSWTISNNIIAASNTVIFYAMNDADAQVLSENLLAYSSQLPTEVQVQMDR